MEVAGEIGVPLTNGYNGNLTFAQNGSVGGYMVKQMIEAQERQMANKSALPLPLVNGKVPGSAKCRVWDFLFAQHGRSLTGVSPECA